MKVVLLNEKQRKSIVNMAKPQAKDYYSYQNLDLLTAVHDEEKNLYLTMTGYMSASIMRTDDRSDHYSFALITRLGCFSVSCNELDGNYSGVFSPLPVLISGKRIKEMIECYLKSYSERRALKKEATKDIDTGGKGFTEWYLESNCFKKTP